MKCLQCLENWKKSNGCDDGDVQLGWKKGPGTTTTSGVSGGCDEQLGKKGIVIKAQSSAHVNFYSPGFGKVSFSLVGN